MLIFTEHKIEVTLFQANLKLWIVIAAVVYEVLLCIGKILFLPAGDILTY